MKFIILLLLFIMLVSLDKTLTYYNLSVVSRNKDVDYLSMEKNPLARWFFEKAGLIGGSLLYGVVSVATLFGFFYLMSFIFNKYVALWTIFIIYGLVIFNNIYFLLKNTGRI